MKRLLPALLLILTLTFNGNVGGQGQPPTSQLTKENVRDLALRGIGPAFTPGRIADVAIDPRNPSSWYVAVASGGLWKTTNRGLSWRPIFDNYGSYSLGCVTIDPNDSNVIWLGTGENSSQRSVGYGDGVYKSTDGGASWKMIGLPKSEHIAKIVVDPRTSNVVYVAAQGPLWAPGGERGLYKTTDGGLTWKPVLQISENTEVSDLVMDPRNPEVLYAAAYQRRRNVGMLVGGGPEGGIHKTEDGGNTWTKLTKGIPTVDIGRIALALSPQNPDTIYAHITAAGKETGFFRTDDKGATWTRASTYALNDPQYYGEIVADPRKEGRVYSLDMNVQITEDGGKTFQRANWNMHVDNHSIAFDPSDPRHMLVGNDGGLYETYDDGQTWRSFNNLSTAQFYRVGIDNARPFYHLYGGTQDNGSQGVPSRTTNRAGIRTSDAINVGGGDGFQARVDPQNPNIVYSMSQNGAITRLDLNTSASKGIRPQGGNVRWNWDVPFIISPHSASRLYLGGSRLFRSDNRGDKWETVSPDLTRQLDRDKLPIMGKVWGPDAVTRNLHTTSLSVGSALAESPLKEGLLIFGTDDGLIQITEDGGKNWRKLESFPGVPEMTYVADVAASNSDVNTIYAAFNNHQRGDFKPYLLKSTDLGKSWTSIAGNLPDRHVLWSVLEDPVNKDLLFAGTEFGLFFTVDGGKQWTQLSGAPTIPFRDLEIQRRENDLVAATFGRGFFILDDYSPLRHLTAETLTKEGGVLLPRTTYLFNEQSYVRASPGNFSAPNPPFGALLTYYLNKGVSPSDTKLVLNVTDANDRAVRQLSVPGTAGLHRVVWDLRSGPTTAAPAAEGPQRGGQGERGGQRGQGARGGGRGGPGGAPLVSAGTYKVTLGKLVEGKVTPIGETQTFEVVPLPK